MSKQFIAHHGDLDFFKISKLPKGAELLAQTDNFVAQEGETTGHMHRIKSDNPFKVYGLGDRVMYVLEAPAEISHEEHRTLTFEPGIYEKEQEQEENAQSGLIQRVID